MIVIAASDFHFPHADPKALRVLERCLIDNPRAEFVLNGDVLDGVDFDVEWGAFLRWATSVPGLVGSRRPVDFVLGNHDAPFVDRLVPALRSLGIGFHALRLFSGPFCFTHGTQHGGFYTGRTVTTGEARVTVVGHAHTPQACSPSAGKMVYGLPCMALQDVPDATLGFGIARYFGGPSVSFEHVLIP